MPTTIADMLAAPRIDWRAIETAGGDIAAIYAEAVMRGDARLASLAQRALERSMLRRLKAAQARQRLRPYVTA